MHASPPLPMPSLSVLIVDGHPLVRLGLSTAVSRQPDMRVAAMAETAARARLLFRRHRPDLVLMELRLPDLNGSRLTQALLDEFPEARVVIVSSDDGDESIHQALQAGAMSYLFKTVAEEELLHAIREVHAGRRYLPQGVTARLHEGRDRAPLTRRETELFDLLGKGLSNRELGRVLGISEDTVKTHLKSLFRKLDVSDRTEAVREGLRRGFVQLL